MSNPNAKQKQWLKDITEWAYDGGLHELYGVEFYNNNFQRHHVLGRSAKHNKVHIGHWFILPVPFDLHDVSSNNPLNVTHHKHKFTDEFGMQRDLFRYMVDKMKDSYEVPPQEVLDAIGNTYA